MLAKMENSDYDTSTRNGVAGRMRAERCRNSMEIANLNRSYKNIWKGEK